MNQHDTHLDTHLPEVEDLIAELESLADPAGAAGMARFGISGGRLLGIRIPVLRAQAKRIGKNHAVAAGLWESSIHEARILAGMIEDPSAVTDAQMEAWAADFDSWDLCDQVNMNLFRHIPAAWEKALEWSSREAEFVKRSGFALMACLASGDKSANDQLYEPFFAAIVREACDGRNFVKKAVNWALRQMGKRSPGLYKRAIVTAEELQALDCPAAKWIAADALRELRSHAVTSTLTERELSTDA